jgi:uncharacterized membrane protein
MSQIRNILVAVIGLTIVYFFIQTARTMGAPSIFTLVGILMVVLIIFNVARSLIRGY